ncbi:SIS domain-containing protein [Athalassotoga saccharophila]|uniref:SIS domain-containing protein n=1 Tax=Athalassotoga saccharophila TaxID=1441386 RepID=UPI0018D6087B|nr:SIS domain-containing protein [Athalassotoga saccharophila]BBJ27445.1 glutamine--fructose-6-phosphate aminotransferase [isomerizing] [Athalassotoga saccharophila]
MAYRMIEEIHETLEVIERLISNESKKIEKIANVFKNLSPSVMIAAGRGTSDNACIYGQYLFESEIGIPVALALGSLYTHYKMPPNLKNGVVMGISQSGETEDVCEILRQSANQGVFTFGITNNPESTMTKILGNNAIFMNAGVEKSVAATKTFTASMAGVLLLAYAVKGKKFEVEDLKVMYEKIFNREEEIRDLSQRYSFARDLVIIGTGFNYPVALESALKLKETCYISAQGLSSVDLVHGPLAMLDPDIPVLIFAPNDSTIELSAKVVEKIKETGSHTLIISDNDELLKKGDLSFKILPSKKELYPFENALFIQLFAFNLSISKGLNPDVPRFLHKVSKI